MDQWYGDHSKYGLEYDGPASMRIDIEKMYGTLLVPRECRKIENQFDCLQLHNWDNINADGSHFPIPGINIRKSGVAFDVFERRRTGVSLQSGVLKVKTQLTEIVSGVVSFGVGFVPVVGPLLAYCSTAVIDTIDDLGKLKSTFTSFFDGKPDLSKAVVETLINYAKHYIKKKKQFSFTLPTSGYVSGSIPGLISGPVGLPGSGPGIGQALQEEQEVDLFAHCTPVPTLYGDEVEECAKHPEWYTLVKVPSDVVLREEDDSEEPTTAGSGEANDVDVAPAPAPASDSQGPNTS